MKSTYVFVAAMILIVLFGTMYGVAQQVLRGDADMPQIQLAEDAAWALDAGAKPLSLTPGKIDINKSLAPFVIVYDKTGHVVSSSGRLDKTAPQVPLGVLKAANNHEYNAVTWQPQSDLRFATVAVAAKDYYVVSARSLKLVEQNENRSLVFSVLGCGVSLLMLAVAFVFTEKQGRN